MTHVTFKYPNGEHQWKIHNFRSINSWFYYTSLIVHRQWMIFFLSRFLYFLFCGADFMHSKYSNFLEKRISISYTSQRKLVISIVCCWIVLLVLHHLTCLMACKYWKCWITTLYKREKEKKFSAELNESKCHYVIRMIWLHPKEIFQFFRGTLSHSHTHILITHIRTHNLSLNTIPVKYIHDINGNDLN